MTTGTAAEEMIPRSALELYGAITTRMLTDAHFTTDTIIKITEDQRDALARAYIDLYDSLADIPESIRTVQVDRLLRRGSVDRDTAERHLHGNGAS